MLGQVCLELSQAPNSVAIKKISECERPRHYINNSPSYTHFYGADIGTLVLFLTVSGARRGVGECGQAYVTFVRPFCRAERMKGQYATTAGLIGNILLTDVVCHKLAFLGKAFATFTDVRSECRVSDRNRLGHRLTYLVPECIN